MGISVLDEPEDVVLIWCVERAFKVGTMINYNGTQLAWKGYIL